MYNPSNTLDKLIAENKWFYDIIENAKIEDKMMIYSPTIEISFNINLDDSSVPYDIMKSIHTKFYTRNEDEC